MNQDWTTARSDKPVEEPNSLVVNRGGEYYVINPRPSSYANTGQTVWPTAGAKQPYK